MAALVVPLFGALAILVPAPVAFAATVPYSGVPVSGWSVNGTVQSVLVLGGTVYVGGTFTQAYGPGGSPTVARANLAAFDAASGALGAGFVANTNGSVRAIATDGSRLFVGGTFTQVNGVSRSRVAAVDPSTGAVATGFTASANGPVFGLAVSGARLFLGGNFTSVNGVARGRAAAVTTSSGSLDPFNPNANNQVFALVTSPDGAVVYVAGAFTAIGGAGRTAVAAVDAGTGTARAPVFATTYAPTLDLAITPDGSRLLGASGGAGNQVAAWSTTTGTRIWRNRADGDVQAVAYAQGNVYFGFHEGFEGDQSVKLLAADAVTGAIEPAFRPSVDDFWGVFAVDATADVLVVGGNFTTIAGSPQRGFAIFAAGPPAPEPVELVPMSASWRFDDTGTDRGMAWTVPSYEDTAWSSGVPQFGYGDADETTVVSYGPDPSNKYITTYFRTAFALTSLPASATIHLVADDGAVVYVNGVEAVRDNMPAGPIGFATRALSNRSGSAENLERSFTLDPASLRTGGNVIAVEVHQDSPGSSDLSFALRLVGVPGSSSDTTPPSTPIGLRATAVTASRIDLAWDPAVDDVGVAAYDVYRDGVEVGETTGLTFSDPGVLPSSTYAYTVRARDAAGNQSAASAALQVTTPTPSGAFADGFESGDTSAWTVTSGLTVQTVEVRSGTYAARGTTANGRTWVATELVTPLTDVTVQAAFKVISRSTTMTVLRLQRSGGTANTFSVFVTSGGFLAVRNDVTAVTTVSASRVDNGVWHVVEVHAIINGTNSVVDVEFDGLPVGALSGARDLGSIPVGRVLLGDNVSGRVYDVAFDDVVII